MRRIGIIVFLLFAWIYRSNGEFHAFLDATEQAPIAGSRNFANLEFRFDAQFANYTNQLLRMGVGLKTSGKSSPEYCFSYGLLRIENFCSDLFEDKSSYQIVEPYTPTVQNEYYLNIGLIDNQVSSSTKQDIDWARCLIGWGRCYPHGYNGQYSLPFCYIGCSYSSFEVDAESRENIKAHRNSLYSGFAVITGAKFIIYWDEHLYTCPQGEIKYLFAGTKVLRAKAGIDFSYFPSDNLCCNRFGINIQAAWNRLGFSHNSMPNGNVYDDYLTLQFGFQIPINFF